MNCANNTDWHINLISWYLEHKREMPWRSTPTPYYVWISEIMLQQTQVSTVIPYFDRFIQRFPNVESLANSPVENVLKLWEGLGYYSRSRNLHKAAKVIIEEHNGIIPNTPDLLSDLPGIGFYTSASISSIAFGVALPAVDGNVLRVYSRLTGSYADISKISTRLSIFNDLLPVIEKANPSYFNQALMELGALVCKPRNPQCASCPIATACFAFSHHEQDILPVKKKKHSTTTHFEFALVIRHENSVLIRKRDQNLLKGFWELPTFLRAEKSNNKTELYDYLEQEFKLLNPTLTELPRVKHAYSHFKLEIQPLEVILEKAMLPSPQIGQFCDISRLHKLPWSTAYKKILMTIKPVI